MRAESGLDRSRLGILDRLQEINCRPVASRQPAFSPRRSPREPGEAIERRKAANCLQFDFPHRMPGKPPGGDVVSLVRLPFDAELAIDRRGAVVTVINDRTSQMIAIEFPELTILGIPLGYLWTKQMLSVAARQPDIDKAVTISR
jgi:hypothetical protein